MMRQTLGTVFDLIGRRGDAPDPERPARRTSRSNTERENVQQTRVGAPHYWHEQPDSGVRHAGWLGAEVAIGLGPGHEHHQKKEHATGLEPSLPITVSRRPQGLIIIRLRPIRRCYVAGAHHARSGYNKALL
eukprot:1937503-Rhodomonas_salina.2